MNKLIYSFLLLVFSFSVHAIIVAGDRVYIDDSQAYIESPLEITSSGVAYYTIRPKNFTGNINILYGFNRDDITFTGAERYVSQQTAVNNSLTCDDTQPNVFYNYTLNPKVAYCYRHNTTTQADDLQWSHSFDTANLATDTIYYTTYYDSSYWWTVNSKLNKINANLLGRDTWYYATNIPVSPSNNLSWRVTFNFPLLTQAKYDVAIYPSSYGANYNGLLQAYNDGNLYLLDPFINSTKYEIGNLSNSTNVWTSDANATVTTISYQGTNKEITLGINSTGITGVLLSTGLKHWYDFSESNSSVKDKVNNANLTLNATSSNAQVNTTGKLTNFTSALTPYGNTVTMNHSNNTVFGGVTNFTFIHTLYWQDLTGGQMLFSKMGYDTFSDFYLFKTAGHALEYSFTNSSAPASSSAAGGLSINVWYCIAMVYDGSRIWVTRNGTTIVNDTLAGGTLNNNAERMLTVANSRGGTQPLHATTQQFIYYNRTLSYQEIEYACQSPSMYENTTFYGITAATYNTSNNTYTSNYIPLSVNVTNFNALWMGYFTSTHNLTLNLTCNANDAVPSWRLATNNTDLTCAQQGNTLRYIINLSGNATLTPIVQNLTITFTPRVTPPEVYITGYVVTNGSRTYDYNLTITNTTDTIYTNVSSTFNKSNDGVVTNNLTTGVWITHKTYNLNGAIAVNTTLDSLGTARGFGPIAMCKSGGAATGSWRLNITYANGSNEVSETKTTAANGCLGNNTFNNISIDIPIKTLRLDGFLTAGATTNFGFCDPAAIGGESCNFSYYKQGFINASLSAGNYTFTVNDTRWATTSENHTITSSAYQNFTYQFYPANTIMFRFLDEQNNSLIDYDTVTAYLTGSLGSYNFTTTTGTYNLTGLIPQEYIITYSGTLYSQRQYFYDLTNGTQTQLDLFLLNDTTDTIILASVFDTVGRRVSNATIYMNKKNLSGTNYYTVETCTTNVLGQCLLHVDLYDTTYQFVINYGGTDVFTSGDTSVSSTSISFTIVTSTSGLADVYGVGYFNGNLTYANATGTFTYTFTDTSDVFSSVCLKLVYSSGATVNSYSNNCTTSNSGSLTQVLNFSVGDEWTGISYGVMNSNGDTYNLQSLSVVVNQGLVQFGKPGLFYFGFLLLGVMAFSALVHPIIPPVISAVAVWVLNSLGFIGVGAAAAISLISVAIIIIFINKKT